MSIRPNFKQIKRIPTVLFGLIAFYFILNIVMCFNAVNETRVLTAKTSYLKQNTATSATIGENHFIAGAEGRLFWKIKNLKEAFLINLSDPEGINNFYDLFYFLILNAAIFWMVKDLTENTIFSEKLMPGLTIVGYLILLYPLMGILFDLIARKSIEALTDHQFTYPWRSFSMTRFFLIGFLLQIVPYFIKQGKILQQEQDLTV